MKRCKKWISIVLALMLLLSGCSNRGAGDPTTDTTAPGTRPAGNLICVEISRFSGGFVEDGSDTQVQDVAAILVARLVIALPSSVSPVCPPVSGPGCWRATA